MTRNLLSLRLVAWLCFAGLCVWSIGFGAQSSAVRVTVEDPLPDHVRLHFDIPMPSIESVNTEVGSRELVRISGEQLLAVPGQPALPVISRMVQVAATGDLEVNILHIEEEEVPASIDGPALVPVDHSVLEPEIMATGLAYPDWTVLISEPVIAGGVRLASLSIAPVQYDMQRNVYHVVRHIEVSVTSNGGMGSNPLTRSRPISEAFAEVFEGAVVNWLDSNPVHYGDLRGRYLIIVHDNYLQYPWLDPLIEWKRLKGYEVLVAGTPSETGSSAESIRSYIQGVYDSEGPPLSYVLLVGDVDVTYEIPTFTIHSPAPGSTEIDVSDHPYSMLEGEDYFPDVFVGRMSIRSLNEIRIVVNKILQYEKTPYTGSLNPNWFRNACIVAGNYSDTGLTPLTPVWTSIWIQEKFLDYGFTRVDTFFYWDASSQISPSQISSSINQGVSWVSYRGFADGGGWQYPSYSISNVGSLSNGTMLPIVTSFVCKTGDFGNDYHNPVFGEAWVTEGSVATPRAGVAFVGASDLYTNTRFNNPLAAGFFTGVLEERLSHLGQALLRAKMELYNGFPTEQETGEYCEFYFYVYNLLGDPELNMRTLVPIELSADHPDEVYVGASFVEITPRVSGGDIEPYTTVTLFKEGETHVSVRTSADGIATLPLNLETEGALTLTVFKRNTVPYVAEISVVNPGTYAGLQSVSYVAGGDEVVSPGEEVQLTVTLKNTGSTALSDVSATLSSSDTLIDIVSGTSDFGNMSSGAAAQNLDPLTIGVHEETLHNHQAMMTLTVSASGQGPWTHHFWVPIWGAHLWASTVMVQDGGNGVLDPGETAEVEIWLHNDGIIDANNVQVEVYSYDNSVTFPDPIGTYTLISVGDSAVNSSDRFSIHAENDVTPGRLVNLVLTTEVNGVPSAVMYTSFTIGEVDSTAPLGPDDYGYWCYDIYDVSYQEEAPTFGWIELDPDSVGPGATGYLLYDDKSTVIDLPFTFTYYGQNCSQVTICDNGWMSFGSTWMASFRNWHLPSALGPPALVAGFWDDLRGHPDGNNDPLPREVWTSYDDENDRFILEWCRWYNRYGYDNQEYYEASFEIILRDPAAYPTATGDGEIIMQYYTAENVDASNNYATVGIENREHTSGLQYTFADLYPPTCPRLTHGVAIKFTTDPPDQYLGAEENQETPMPDRIALLPGYPNPFNSQAEFPLELSRRARVQVSVFNVLGQRVAVLRDEVMEAGRYRVVWNASDLSSGIYFVTMNAGAVVQVQKIVLLK